MPASHTPDSRAQPPVMSAEGATSCASCAGSTKLPGASPRCGSSAKSPPRQRYTMLPERCTTTPPVRCSRLPASDFISAACLPSQRSLATCTQALRARRNATPGGAARHQPRPAGSGSSAPKPRTSLVFHLCRIWSTSPGHTPRLPSLMVSFNFRPCLRSAFSRGGGIASRRDGGGGSLSAAASGVAVALSKYVEALEVSAAARGAAETRRSVRGHRFTCDVGASGGCAFGPGGDRRIPVTIPVFETQMVIYSK